MSKTESNDDDELVATFEVNGQTIPFESLSIYDCDSVYDESQDHDYTLVFDNHSGVNVEGWYVHDHPGALTTDDGDRGWNVTEEELLSAMSKPTFHRHYEGAYGEDDGDVDEEESDYDSSDVRTWPSYSPTSSIRCYIQTKPPLGEMSESGFDDVEIDNLSIDVDSSFERVVVFPEGTEPMFSNDEIDHAELTDEDDPLDVVHDLLVDNGYIEEEDDQQWIEVGPYKWEASSMVVYDEGEVSRWDDAGYVVTADRVKYNDGSDGPWRPEEKSSITVDDIGEYGWFIPNNFIDDEIVDEYFVTVNDDPADLQYGVMEDANGSVAEFDDSGELRIPTSHIEFDHSVGFYGDDDEIPSIGIGEGSYFHELMEERDSAIKEAIEDVDGAEIIDELERSEGEQDTLDALDEMKEIIEERDGSGDPHEIHESIAEVWSWYLGMDVTASDVGRLMTLLKITRAKEGDGDRDDDLDAGNYMAIVGSMWGINE